MIVNRLEELMTENKIDAYQLSEEIGVNRNTIYNMLKKSDSLTAYKTETLSKICRFFSISIDDFLFFVEDGTPSIKNSFITSLSVDEFTQSNITFPISFSISSLYEFENSYGILKGNFSGSYWSNSKGYNDIKINIKSDYLNTAVYFQSPFSGKIYPENKNKKNLNSKVFLDTIFYHFQSETATSIFKTLLLDEQFINEVKPISQEKEINISLMLQIENIDVSSNMVQKIIFSGITTNKNNNVKLDSIRTEKKKFVWFKNDD